MGDSSGGTETVTQNSEPWSQSQPYLQDIFGQAQSNYRAGAQYYPGSTVVPYSPETMQGLDGISQNSQGAPVGFDTASNTVQSVAGQSGNNNPFVSQIKVASNQKNDAGSDVLQDFANNGQSNPFLDKAYDNAAERVRDNTAAMFSKAGRYGSVAHQDQLSDSLGDMATNMYGQAYETDANRRFGAAEALGARQNGDINRQMQGGAAAGGLSQGVNNQALQAAGMLPGLNTYQNANNQNLMNVGNAREIKAGQEVQDSMNRWNFGQNAGWDLLSRYNQTVQPLAGLGGSSTQTGPGGQSSAGGAIQGGLGGASAGFAIGGPWGAAIGGGLGALGGIL